MFAAGLALRRIEHGEAKGGDGAVADAAQLDPKREELATGHDTAPAFMAQAVLSFNEQIERLGEIAVMLVVGSVLARTLFASPEVWLLVLLLLALVRPLSVLAAGKLRLTAVQLRLTCWFGVRGIGSIYYLAYAMTHGLDPELGRRLAALTLGLVTLSILAHGVTVTPLMRLYEADAKVKRRSSGSSYSSASAPRSPARTTL